jgi:hypothetical protein
MRGRMSYHGLVSSPLSTPAQALETPPAARKPSAKPPAKLSAKRRRCICGCRRLFLPAKPWQKFYEDQCRKQYHRYGAAFGALKRDGLRRLLKEARAQIRGEFRALAEKAIEDVMRKSGWSDQRTLAIDLSPLALKGALDTLSQLLRELRSDHVRLEARLEKLVAQNRIS